MFDLDQTDLAELEAALETDKGTMVLSFFPDRAPRHVRNFLQLAQEGYYDGLAFHRIVRNFMIQGGCPNTREGADGTAGHGGPEHRLEAEFSDMEHRRGVLSMARGQDANSAGSQFFIVHAEHAKHLDGQYTAFGKVEEGLDVLDEIASVDVDFNQIGERSDPVEQIVIRGIELRKRELPPEPVAEAEGASPETPTAEIPSPDAPAAEKLPNPEQASAKGAEQAGGPS